MTSGASEDDEEPYQEGLGDVPVMLNDVDIHVKLHSEEYIHTWEGPSRATSIRILPPSQTVSIDLEGGSSVGPYAQQFTTYLGVCKRVHCNIWQRDYMTLPPEKEEAILRDLQDQMT
ncbi:hypothetical protein Taro_051540 [Colocasia esculenta]|uniref:Uncharacterized protein n=1 Tax=Colocasia esculenta TaxID=4460 RepID=A0A843XHB7_COLES|nr:hypothetical protein [Colocasia esculenta]